jgi:phage gp45-like
MVGMTAYPLKQQEEEKQQGQQQQSSQQQSGEQDDGLNHNQPKGPSAEALMLYLNGSRAHPVALVDDRRVRPYGMSEGEGAHYAPDGSEQMVLFKENGTYVVGLDGKSVKDKKEKKTRMVSIRHVEKEMQTHKIEQKAQGQQQSGQQQQKEKYKHEGKSVNTEVRLTKGRIEFRDGDEVVGYYDKQAKKWWFKGNTIEHEAQTMKATVSNKFVTVGKTLLGSEDATHNVYGNAGTGKTSDKVFVKAILPGPPTSLDTQA